MRVLFQRSLVVAAVLMVLTSLVRAQSSGDRPEGVSPEKWIRISDSLGIAVLSTSPPPFDPSRFPPNFPIPPPDRLIYVSLGGVLMAKYNGYWTRVDIIAPPAQPQPLPLNH